MKTILIILLCLCLPAVAKPKKKQFAPPVPAFSYIVKGFEAYYISHDEILVVGLDLNCKIVLKAYPELPLSVLEENAVKVVDALAKDSL